jgi:hypothetical protein
VDGTGKGSCLVADTDIYGAETSSSAIRSIRIHLFKAEHGRKDANKLAMTSRYPKTCFIKTSDRITAALAGI